MARAATKKAQKNDSRPGGLRGAAERLAGQFATTATTAWDGHGARHGADPADGAPKATRPGGKGSAAKAGGAKAAKKRAAREKAHLTGAAPGPGEGAAGKKSQGGTTAPSPQLQALVSASLGEAVAESLSGPLTESINDSFTEMMAGGLATALEQALAETVSSAVARELPGALAAAAEVAEAAERAPSSPGAQGRGAAGDREEPDGHAVELAAARAVWDSLPPRRLPALPGLDLAARRIAASDPERIGGDWYDVTALNAGTVVLGVGDVAGHGPGAGALMAELCHAARAYALLDLSPAHIVSRLARVLLASGQPALASALTARLDVESGRLTWCNAGHPPPVLVRPDGAVSFLGDVHGPLLGGAMALGPGAGQTAGPSGGMTPAAYSQSSVTVPVGATVVLYTAGMVDRSDVPLAERLDMLAASAGRVLGNTSSSSGAPRPLAVACDELLGALAGQGQTRASDAGLLAARLG